MSEDNRMGPVITDKRASQWEELMRKFSAAHKEQCKAISLDIPRAPRSIKRFPTGSTYEGTWDVLGMSGYGVYCFPNDVVYEGEFEDGMFHGQGELRYPSGAILKGQWKKGIMTERKLIFAEGLEYAEEDWKYCRMPDRRFTIEYEEGLQPAGQSFLTASQPTRDIPSGYYDTEDGFYDPKTKVVYSPEDLTVIIRAPSTKEQKWIVENCRTNPDVPLGPRPELYEEWFEPELQEPVLPAPASASRATMALQGSDDWDYDMSDMDDDTFWRRGTIREQKDERWHTRKVIKFEPTISTFEPTITTSETNIFASKPTITIVDPNVATSTPEPIGNFEATTDPINNTLESILTTSDPTITTSESNNNND